MNIADKLIKGKIELDNDELKFLLWNSLIQLSSYDADVTSMEEETFNIEEMLSAMELDGKMLDLCDKNARQLSTNP